MKYMSNLQVDKEKFDSDSESYLDDLIQKQVTINDYSILQPLSLSNRGKIAEWMYRLNIQLGASFETFFKAMHIFDQFLSKSKKQIAPSQSQLVISVCYYIAHKFEDVFLIDLKFLKTAILHDKFTQNEIIQAEMTVLKTINFRLNTPNQHHFSNVINQLVKVKFYNDKQWALYEKIYHYVELMALLVEDFVFEKTPIDMCLININVTLIFLKNLHAITDRQYLNIVEDLASINRALMSEEIADSFYSAIKDQEETLMAQKNLFLTIYHDALQIA